MQEFFKDYSYEKGCCLDCENSKEGCLCYSCKCRRCYYYTSPEKINDWDSKGFCDIALELRSGHRKKEIYYKKCFKEQNKKLQEKKRTILGLHKNQTQLGDS